MEETGTLVATTFIVKSGRQLLVMYFAISAQTVGLCVMPV